MAEKLDELKAHLLQDVQGLEEGDKDVDDLDSGAYGFVFKVSVAGLPCMAKKLHRILTNKEVSADDRKCIQGKFYDECVLLSKLSHPNIVHFVGVCYGKSESDLMLVMERLKSDLATFVEKRKNIPISIKVSILLDISYGLLYLHNQTPPLIHRDLTAPNILLTEDCRAKIADLGVSKFLTDPHIIKQTMAPGNLSYMAPETKIEIPQYGTSMDIFSFGHLILHTSIQSWPKTFRVFNLREIEPGKVEIAERKYILEEQMTKSHPLYQLAINCLQDEPKLRPSTAELNKTLNQLSTKHPKSPGDVASILEEVQLREADHRMIEQLIHEAQLMTAEKLSLQKQLEKTTRKLKCQEKQLEIVANEKAAMTDEIAQTKATNGAKSLANTSNLKAKVEEANTKLLKTQQELQRCQGLIKTMEEDNQDQMEQAKATAMSNKLAAEMDLLKAQRQVEAFERELQEHRELLEAMRIEVDRRNEVEQKLLSAEAECDTRYQVIKRLKEVLKQHGIAVPVFNIDRRESHFGQQQRGSYPRDRVVFDQQQAPSVSTFDVNMPSCYQGDQQNQPIQWQGGHNPNQHGGFNQDPQQNQQFQLGYGCYAQGRPSFNRQGQQHHRGHHPPPKSPQAQNYPPTSYAQGNPSPYHQHDVNQSQQPPRGGVPRSQAIRHQPAPEVRPTPLPRRNSRENVPNAPRPKQNSSVQENILLQDIDRDIKDAAKFVIHEGEELESMGPNAPFDPHLICPLCMRNFRVGEIQKYRKHVNTCQG